MKVITFGNDLVIRINEIHAVRRIEELVDADGNTTREPHLAIFCNGIGMNFNIPFATDETCLKSYNEIVEAMKGV